MRDCATVGPEQQNDETCRRREARIVARALAPIQPEHPEANRSVARHGPGLEQTGQFSDVVDVQVRQQHDIDLRQRQLRHAEPRERARPGIDEEARRAVDEHQIAGPRGADGARLARAQHDERQGGSRSRRRPELRARIDDKTKGKHTQEAGTPGSMGNRHGRLSAVCPVGRATVLGLTPNRRPLSEKPAAPCPVCRPVPSRRPGRHAQRHRCPPVSSAARRPHRRSQHLPGWT